MNNSVYIHIPFCNAICSYCNFTKFFYQEKMVSNYLKSLQKEIEKQYKGEMIKTLYIGGGTPSCLTIDELKQLFECLKLLKLEKDCEFTIEVNPESITKEKIDLFLKNKVNRISMGVESTIKENLIYLGRKHDFNLVKEKIKLLKKMGITNINVDLIYALKDQTIDSLKKDLENILSLEVPHISTYSLMIEPHTVLGIKKEECIDEELDSLMYDCICKQLKEAGYSHYEVSNFSKVGYESKHNLTYWNNEFYYGFGLSSAGYIDDIRYVNTTSIREYIKGNFISSSEKISIKEKLSYALILGFRKIDGINKVEFKNKYNVDIYDLYNIKELVKEKLLVDNGMNIFVNYDKIYIENSILINFVGE